MENFTFEIIDEDMSIVEDKPKKAAKVRKPRKDKSPDEISDWVIPEIIEIEEVDSCLIFSNKKPKLYFDECSTRYYHSKEDWELLRSLVIMKCVRKNRKKENIVLDDIVEFRLMPSVMAEELCNYLFRNDINFVVYEENNNW